MNTRSILARNLRAAMRRARITNAGVLAKMSGVSRRGIGHILSLETDARIGTVEKLATALGVKTSELLES